MSNNSYCSQKLYVQGQFNNNLWRFLLNSIIADIDQTKKGLSVISPFGFEVMQDKRFLKCNLRRFYCYLGIPKHIHFNHDDILAIFDKQLFDLLKNNHSDFYRQIVLKINNEKFIKLKERNYVCGTHDKLIDIQLRPITTTLLDDYADYLISSLSAIYYGQDEPKEFLFNARFRNRTYQLYVILERLFGSYIDKMKDCELSYLNHTYKKINNMISIFYNDQLLYTKADALDKTILDNLIMPRTAQMMAALTNANDVIAIKSKSYHVNDELSISISKQIYDSTKQLIINSYHEYY